jgi:hypothetical protein
LKSESTFSKVVVPNELFKIIKIAVDDSGVLAFEASSLGTNRVVDGGAKGKFMWYVDP